MTPLRCALLIPVLLSACAESGPVTVRVFGLDPSTGQYGHFDARLHSLHDVTEMRGESVRFVGSATLVADLVEQEVDPKGGQVLRAEGGAAPACSFSERDGVLHADDYDSLNMASAYFALERSRDLFIDLGVDPAGLNALNAYYHPRLQLGTKVFPTFWVLTDNAAYAPPFDGFLIIPHLVIQGAPFTVNQGVMAHEYSHKVFNRLVERGANVQAWIKNDWSTAATNQFRGVDEGVADIYGHLATNDPDYIQASLGGQTLAAIDRDLTKRRVMSQSDADAALALLSNDVADFDPHGHGAFVAAALWRFGEDLGDHRRVAVAVLEVLGALGEAIEASPRYDFSTIEFLSRVATKFDGTERAALCAIYRDRFEALIQTDTAHELEACQ